MSVQFTIIGLGRVGTSIGLALAGRARRVGYDRSLEAQQQAKSLGACESLSFNLHAAVESADVVLLCLPLSEIEETLRLIAPDLRAGSVLMDTAPVKLPVLEWSRAHLPAGCHYIGLVPALNPACLDESQRAPRADLFANATLGIAAPGGTPEAALNQALGLAKALGAQPLLLDPREADGMLASVHQLPQLIAAGLLNATAGQPGWPEARRLAGRPYVRASEALFEESLPALSLAAWLNREQVLRALEMAIGALAGFHAALQDSDDQDLQRRLELAVDDRLAWWQQRQSADWSAQKQAQEPVLPGTLERLFGSVLARKKKP